MASNKVFADDPPKSASQNLLQINQNLEQTFSEPVKIVKIELAKNAVTVSNSEIHTYVVDAQNIDLRKFQVGAKVTATLKVTTTTDRFTLAKTTRTQLIKLQLPGTTLTP